jgi:ABC-type nitrate/sulfonate/bicarbonate transport system ATPase subunit
LVFQDATLLPWRDLRRNVELLAELYGPLRPPVEVGAQGEVCVPTQALADGYQTRPSSS